MSQLSGDYEITGSLRVNGAITGPIARSNLVNDNTAIYHVPLVDYRVHDAMQTNLGTAASGDLGINSGTYGTAVTHLTSSVTSGNPTEYARQQFVLPVEYVSGGPITFRIRAGVTSAATTATCDVQAFLSSGDTLVSGSDLCTTSAQSCNNLTYANYDFTLTTTSRVAGDVIDVRIALAATGGIGYVIITATSFLLQVKG